VVRQFWENLAIPHSLVRGRRRGSRDGRALTRLQAKSGCLGEDPDLLATAKAIQAYQIQQTATRRPQETD